jgi:hypothetical protein
MQTYYHKPIAIATTSNAKETPKLPPTDRGTRRGGNHLQLKLS